MVVVATAVEAEIGALEAAGPRNCVSIASGKCITCQMSALSWKRIRVRGLQLGVLACGGGTDNAVVINNTSTKLGSNSIISTAHLCSPPATTPAPIPSPTPHSTPNPCLTPNQTAIADTGATGIYFEPAAPVCDVNPQAPAIAVGTATGHVQHSTASAKFVLPQLSGKFPRTGHIMQGFKHTLIDVGQICDADFSVSFTKDSVKIIDPNGKVILAGWRE